MKYFCPRAISLIFCTALAAVAFSSCEGTGEPAQGNNSGDGITGDVVISSSRTFIAAGGEETISLTVYCGDTDITSDATIFIVENGNSSVYNSTTWSSEEEESVQFYASYNSELSERITVRAVIGISELPADPDGLNYDFVKNTIILQATSIGCVYCPYMINALDEYFSSASNASNAIPVAAHTNMKITDPMTSAGSRAILSHYNLTLLPTAIFDLDRSISLSSEATSSLITNRVRTVLNTSAKCGITAAVKHIESAGRICVTAKFKISSDGNYRVAAWLLEDGIQANQYNSTPYEVDNIHDNAVRAISCTSPVTGEYLGGQQSWEAFTEGEFYCEFNLDETNVTNLANCHVVILVTSTRNGGTTYLLDNAVDCPINGSVAYQYEN